MPNEKKVLVIDDDRDSGEVLSMLLQIDGYDTSCALTGKSGIAAATRTHPDIVLLDYMLPDMTGAEVGTQLKADPLTSDETTAKQAATAHERERELLTYHSLDGIPRHRTMLVAWSAVCHWIQRRPPAKDRAIFGGIRRNWPKHVCDTSLQARTRRCVWCTCRLGQPTAG